ncbi:MAG TPA: prepilin-type N-terminal cleavage/methylation domain-containing protein [Pseudomonas sp.]|uniref:type IV pilus modification PilV family protein n=1 Tax=Pseudomonas sp. TaxID=306 RepID=UPI002B46D6F9|nr:prepilin-type N-terminal cleavage/methylation domain-containing protein [Pseudomonas sp.]HKS13264.1 prepilin-type N-terminal cleavage/methylation domain-containing protein [Pseudomonas sp.]
MTGVRERGMTLLEVLMTLAVLSLGVFSSAALQVRTLQMTEEALRASQAALSTYSDSDRQRAPVR